MLEKLLIIAWRQSLTYLRYVWSITCDATFAFKQFLKMFTYHIKQIVQLTLAESRD